MPIHILSLLHIAMVLVVAYHRSASCDLWLLLIVPALSLLLALRCAWCFMATGGLSSVISSTAKWRQPSNEPLKHPLE